VFAAAVLGPIRVDTGALMMCDMTILNASGTFSPDLLRDISIIIDIIYAYVGADLAIFKRYDVGFVSRKA
jgi:hypothetical protein